MDEDDDVPQLSNSTLVALQQFLSEQQVVQEATGNPFQDKKSQLFENDLSVSFPEDWQMSQFWYDQETSELLAAEVMRLTGEFGKAVCVSCPSVFRACKSNQNVHLFEFDKRFQAFGSSFYFYDYNKPEEIPEECKHAYSVIIADPPFLSEECLTKLSVTLKLLATPDAKIILCTGVMMSNEAVKHLPVRKAEFIPKHKNNLGNEFACFTNYNMEIGKLS